jgi:hypothetical protein
MLRFIFSIIFSSRARKINQMILMRNHKKIIKKGQLELLALKTRVASLKKITANIGGERDALA